MSDDPFDSPREVLARAGEHIDALEARIKVFFDRKPYARVIDFDRDTGQEVHKIRLTGKIPGSVAAVAKDAFSNLRDALDHAVYASAVAIRPGTSPSRTSFPFAYSAVGVHDKLNKDLVDVPPVIRTLIEGLRPHQTGNQTLWGLNCVRNAKTHRMLVPLGAVSLGNSLRFSGAVRGPSQIGYHRWHASKNEVEYLRLGRGSNVHYEVTATFDVLFGDVEVFGGRQAIATLKAVADEVERILGAIEAETGRLLQIST